jgi:hypothetical protein
VQFLVLVLAAHHEPLERLRAIDQSDPHD